MNQRLFLVRDYEIGDRGVVILKEYILSLRNGSSLNNITQGA